MNKVMLHSDRISKIEKIIHVADIHIRNLKRHDEYIDVFNKLYSYCNDIVSKNKNTVIYLAGDIVHAKTDMSPELVLITRELFANLCNIAPVILILGNHDCMLSNPNRMDALTPVVSSMEEFSDFFFLKDTGIYQLANVEFTVNSVYDEPENFIRGDYETDNVKIVLFHGAIDNAYTTSTMRLQNNKIRCEMFDGFDFGMFGDIHKMQYMDSNNRFAYAGSLIQQNFGEELGHGFILWDIEKKTSEFIEIKNDWAFHTIDVDNGKIINMPSEFAKTNRIRIRSKNTTNSDLSLITTNIRNITNVLDIRIQRIADKNITNGSSIKTVQGDIRDVEYQNELISNYLIEKYSVGDEIIDNVKKINREINTSLGEKLSARNSVWRPIRFQFSNMFSYAENNHIDFENMQGVYGIFAPNASGKSSILDAITFCIFDKCSRTFKASKIMNNKKNDFYCILEFEMNGVHYFIDRTATKNKQGVVRVNVNFWHLNDAGERVLLNGEDRDATNAIIRSHLGTYDDFIITALSVQGNNTNFIDKQQRERKDLLAQFLDLNVFEELNTIASSEIKSVQTLIKEYSKKNYGNELIESKKRLEDAVHGLNTLQKTKATFEEKLKEIDASIFEMSEKILPLDNSLDYDYERKTESLKNEVSSLNTVCDDIKSNILLTKRSLDVSREEHSRLKSVLNDIEIVSIKQRHTEYKELKSLEDKIKFQIEDVKQKILLINNNLSKLSQHEYDPNCKYCCNNVFVKDTIESKKLLPELENTLNDLTKKFDETVSDKNSRADCIEKIFNYEKLISEELRIEKEIYVTENKLLRLESEYTTNSAKIEAKRELLQKYENNKISLFNNKQCQESIRILKISKDSLISEMNGINDVILAYTSAIALHEQKINEYVEYINKLKELEINYSAYDYYLKSVSRDGVPYELITKALPKIQLEVNSILSQVVDFQVLFDTDGKNINAYIAYDDDRYWPLEMTSGMEKFISSLAIRTALINITALPRPNFIAIDEGWGVLDSDNLNSLTTLFDYLKTQFDFVLTISHIESLRDIVNNTITITKKNGDSKLLHG